MHNTHIVLYFTMNITTTTTPQSSPMELDVISSVLQLVRIRDFELSTIWFTEVVFTVEMVVALNSTGQPSCIQN